MKEKLIEIMRSSRAYLALHLEVDCEIIEHAIAQFADKLIEAGVKIDEVK